MERSDGANLRIEAAIRPAGGSFGPVQTLSAAGQNAKDPKVAIDSRAGTAVWDRTNGAPSTGSTIQAAIRPPGGVFDFAKNLSVPANAIYADWPAVGVNAHGDAVAVWERGGPYPAAKVIQASFHGPGEDFGPAQSVTDPALVTGRNPQVAVEDSGAALLAWPQAPNGSNQDVLEVATSAPGGLFGTGKPISRATEDANGYGLAVNQHGDAVVVWESVIAGTVRIEASQRPAGEAFDPVQDVTGSDGSPQLPSVAIDDSRNTLAVWKQKVDAQQVIVGASGEAGGPLGAVLTLSHAEQDTNNPSVAASPRGDGLAVWESYVGTDDIVQGVGFDRTAPTLSGLIVPGAATAGLAAPFGVTARDVWSPVNQLTWNFGDGSSAEGDAVQHAFAAPGSFSATVTATDAAGNATTSAASSVAVGAPAVHIPALTLSGVTLKSHRFLVSGRTARTTAKALRRGTVLRYSLSEPATLAITLQRRLPGRRKGSSCVAATQRLARAKRCVRFVRVGRLVHASHAGQNTLPFSGRVGRRALRPGTYRAVVQATADGGRRSRSVRIAFVILRG